MKKLVLILSLILLISTITTKRNQAVTQTLNQYSRNGQYLTFEEFDKFLIDFIKKTKGPYLNKKDKQKIFNNYDEDRNKRLDASELTDLYEGLNEVLSEL
jgi:hypothetical protein